METILVLVFTVVIWVLYHKIFDVVYFDLSRGILKEIIGSLIGGVLLTALTLMYWWVTDIIIVIMALAVIGKCRRSEQKILVVVCAAIIAILIAVAGISVNNEAEKQTQETTQAYGNVVEKIKMG